MMPREVYVLLFRDDPLCAHTRFEGASADMAEYSTEVQKEMRVAEVRLVNDDE